MTMGEFWSNIKTSVILVGIGVVIGGFVGHHIWGEEAATLKAEVKTLKTKYESTIDEVEKTKVELALEKQKENAKITTKTEEVVKYVYVEKEKASDPDIKVSALPPQLKLSYNGEIYDIPMKKITTSSGIANGQLVMKQESVMTLDVTDIVNREIANIIINKDNEIATLKHDKKVIRRQGRQHTFWGAIIAATVTKLIHEID